ncbi:hypothetical protein [Streptomyces zhihengii]
MPAIAMPDEAMVFTGSGTYRFNRRGQLVDPEGAVGVRLLPNDLLGCNPATWYWKVTDNTGDRPRTYTIHLSVDQPQVDLSRIQQVDPDKASYVPVTGPAGASVYETWLAAGHSGSEAEFLTALRGPKGDRGLDGQASVDWSAVTPQAIGADPAGSAAQAKQTAIATSTSHTTDALAAEVERSDASYEPTGAAQTATQTAVTQAQSDLQDAITAEVTRANSAYDPKGSAQAAQDTARTYTDQAINSASARADAAYEASGTSASAVQQVHNYVTQALSTERDRADAAYQPRDDGAATPTLTAYVDTALATERTRADSAYDPAGAADTARQNAAAHAAALISQEQQRADAAYEPAGAATAAQQAAVTMAAAQASEVIAAERQRADGAYDPAGASSAVLQQARNYTDSSLTQSVTAERAASDTRYDPAGASATAQQAARAHTTAAVQASATTERAASDDRYDLKGAATTSGTAAVASAKTYTDQQVAAEKTRADQVVQSAIGGEVTRADAAYVKGTDPRLTDTRIPKIHAASHATGNSDPISPADIGAATAAALTALTNRVAALEQRRLTGVTGKATPTLSLGAGATVAVPVTFDAAMPSANYQAIVQVSGAQSLLGNITVVPPITAATATGCTVTLKNTGLLTLAQQVTVQVTAIQMAT